MLTHSAMMGATILFYQSIIYTFVLVFQLCEGMAISTSSTPTKACPKFYFLDHVTEICEFCCDICCKAEIKRTVAHCESDCPEYAQKLRDEAAQKLLDSKQEFPQKPQQPEDSATDLPLVGQIVIPVVAALLIFLFLALVITKRRTIARMFARPGPAATTPRHPATVPLQPQTVSAQMDVPVSPVEVQQPLLSQRSGNGVQESDKSCAGEGNSWRILSNQQTASYNHSGEAKPSVPESMEGRKGRQVLVLPKNTLMRRDSTEPKTTLCAQGLQQSRV